MLVVDAYVSVFDEARRRHFASKSELVEVQAFFGKGLDEGANDVDALIATMDASGVDLALNSGGLLEAEERVLVECAKYPDRIRAALTVDPLESVGRACRAVEAVARSPLVAAIRVIPMLSGEPLNSRRYYPIYERCEAFGLPVTVNVGIPGPKFRAAVQDPLLLDDVLIDFPELVVVGAHMGHPWEALLIRLMMKYEHLYLSNSAYLARYIDPAIIRFMGSSRGKNKLIFASDEPLIPMGRAVSDAMALDLEDEAKTNFMGENALRVFRWSTDAPLATAGLSSSPPDPTAA
jgi:uncharacterized protein